ncbi:MAG: sulfatase [Halioglobus sp.]
MFGSPGSTIAADAPNFVIIIADDLGWNDIGVYGNTSVQTPNIDKLAANGLRFDNAFLTTSSCSASRASILTGKYPHTNGLVHLHQSLSADQITLGQLLRERGYHTESVGKWHIGDPVKSQFSNVIDDRISPATAHWLDRLARSPKGVPFFFWLASRDPHRPHTPTEDSLPLVYDPAKIEIPEGFVDGPRTRRAFADYYRAVSRFDRDIGRVVAELERQGVLDNTAVIVMSDNGRPFPWGKLTLYDDGIKTPFIVHWPKKVARGATRGQLISMVDLAPTILEWAGLPLPDSMDGISFAEMLGSETATTREYVFAERNWHGSNAHERAIRSLGYLYKENQFPLEGSCLVGPYRSKPSFKEYAAVPRNLTASDFDRECFSNNRSRVELKASTQVGNTRTPNLANSDEYRQQLETMRNRLNEWRENTHDFDYQSYTRPDR